ncbi:Lymphoid-restricted membrane protein, partial [Pygoscelis adeliae]
PPTPQAAFAHLALAFRCDTFTLQQRVQVEKRARDAAEENIQEELGQCRAALEVGTTGCTVRDWRGHRSLGTRRWGGLIPHPAWPQEARMSRAAEVMVQHVENVKRHHMPEHGDSWDPLTNARGQCNSRRSCFSLLPDDAEPRLRPHPLMRTFQQGSARRRVSIAVIPKQLLVQGVPDGAVAAMALPPAELLGFLLAASPEHRLPPPCPRPGAAAAAACGITQGLA